MAMTFFLPDDRSFGDDLETVRSVTPKSNARRRSAVRIVNERLAVPDIGGTIERPRLSELLERSMTQFGASLISGRAGTGKTVAAAAFAASYPRVAWHTVESSDVDWRVFSKYFVASLSRAAGVRAGAREVPAEAPEISEFLISTLMRVGEGIGDEPMLMIFDDVHHVFDAEWFGDFLNLLLVSLLPNTHLLLLCRSKPNLPLWRLRSKQLLSVIDEKVIAFSLEETEELCRRQGRSDALAKQAHRQSFGRISKILQILAAR